MAAMELSVTAFFVLCFVLQSVHCSKIHVNGHIPPAPRKHAMDARHESDHIKDHLDHVATAPDLAKMTAEEMEFHYFKLHDYDENNKLDGVEIGKALTHFDKKSDLVDAEQPVLTEQQLADLVDSVLKDEDGNGDGYIDYAEFVAAQRREEGGHAPALPPSPPESPKEQM